MPAYKNFSLRGVGLIFVLAVLPACVSMPLMVRHADPLTADQHVQLGSSYEAQGEKGGAGDQYSAALKLDKKNVPALIAKGNLAYESGDMNKAEKYFRRALRYDKGNVGAHNNLAMVYLSRGKLEQAGKQLDAALKQNGPLRPYVLETQAQLCIKRAQYADAAKALDEADAVTSPDNAPLREQLTRTRRELTAAQR